MGWGRDKITGAVRRGVVDRMTGSREDRREEWQLGKSEELLPVRREGVRSHTVVQGKEERRAG